jgi:uncharacterized repeat protein (TIGR02543 family)
MLDNGFSDFNLFSDPSFIEYLAYEESYVQDTLQYYLDINFNEDSIYETGTVERTSFTNEPFTDLDAFLADDDVTTRDYYKVMTLEPGFYTNYEFYFRTDQITFDSITYNQSQVDYDLVLVYDYEDSYEPNNYLYFSNSDVMVEFFDLDLGFGDFYFNWFTSTPVGFQSVRIDGELSEKVDIYVVANSDVPASFTYTFVDGYDYIRNYVENIVVEGYILGLLEELYYEDTGLPYIPIVSAMEYVSYFSRLDESLYYQYIQQYPLTDWYYSDLRDKEEFMSTLALDGLYVDVMISYDDPLDGLYGFFETSDYEGVYNFNTYNGVQYTLNEFEWLNGGYDGYRSEYYETFDTYVLGNYFYLPISQQFETLDVSGPDIYELDAGSQDVYFTVPYGASFGLPNELYFYGDEPVYYVNDEGNARYFVLEGYYVFDEDEINASYQYDKDDNYIYWTYDGWYTNPYWDVDFDEFGRAYTTLDVHANWKEVYQVGFFDAEGNLIDDYQYIEYFDDAFAPDYTPYIPTGYEFVEWDTDYTYITSSRDVDLVIQLIQYDITYELDGGTNATSNPDTYDVEDTVTFADPTRTGYTFDGWFDAASSGNEVTGITLGSSGDLTLYAYWTPILYNINYYDVTDGGPATLMVSPAQGENQMQYDIETEDFTLAEPSKTGYTFNGWFSDALLTTPITSVETLGNTGDISIYGKYTINEYTLSFDLNYDGIDPNPADVTQNYNTSVTASLPADPTRTGYDFKGWAQSETAVAADTETLPTTMPAEDIQYYAVWEIQSFTVTFEDHNGTELKSEDVEYGSAATAPTDPT